MLITQRADHIVPVRSVPKHRCADPPSARTGKQPTRGFLRDIEPTTDDRSKLLNDRYRTGALAFGALVDQAARSGCGLPAYRPHPRFTVDVLSLHAGDLTNARSGSGLEPHDVAPALVLAGGCLDQGIS